MQHAVGQISRFSSSPHQALIPQRFGIFQPPSGCQQGQQHDSPDNLARSANDASAHMSGVSALPHIFRSPSYVACWNHKASLDTPSSSTFTNHRFGPPPRSEIRPCLRIHHWHTLASKSLRPRALAGLAGLTGLAGFSLVSLVAGRSRWSGRTQSQILFPDHPVPPSTRISLDTASPTELAP